PWGQVADFDRGWPGAGLELERPGAVLPQREQDDGVGGGHEIRAFTGNAKNAVRRTVSADAYRPPRLRCQPGRPALPDAEARRIPNLRAHANQRGAELAGGVEAESARALERKAQRRSVNVETLKNGAEEFSFRCKSGCRFEVYLRSLLYFNHLKI